MAKDSNRCSAGGRGTALERMAAAVAATLALSTIGACGRIGFDPLGSADASPPARETWTFGEVPDATVSGVTADTLLCEGESDATLNWGGFRRFEGSPFCTGLLRFDLTSLPAGITPIEASVSIWPELVPSVEGHVDVHRVSEGWNEGTLSGEPGVANYVERLPGVDWATRGARPPDSSAATPLHVFHPAALEAQSIPLPLDVVNEWVQTPASNHGLAFFGSEDYGGPDEEHPHFLSSENTAANQRPRLTITFERP